MFIGKVGILYILLIIFYFAKNITKLNTFSTSVILVIIKYYIFVVIIITSYYL
jgi:hypothetical protein